MAGRGMGCATRGGGCVGGKSSSSAPKKAPKKMMGGGMMAKGYRYGGTAKKGSSCG
jgi:hypothetical protein